MCVIAVRWVFERKAFQDAVAALALIRRTRIIILHASSRNKSLGPIAPSPVSCRAVYTIVTDLSIEQRPADGKRYTGELGSRRYGLYGSLGQSNRGDHQKVSSRLCVSGVQVSLTTRRY